MTGLRRRTSTHSASERGAGFTLIEVLLAMALFSITALMAVNLFVIFLQQQRRTISQQELQNDSRSVIEQVAQDLREGTVDYDYYTANFTPAEHALSAALSGTGKACLVLRDALNQQIRYWLVNGVMQRSQTATPTTDACAAGASWSDISPSTLSVTAFQFFITPSENPFGGQSYVACGSSSLGSYNENLCRSGTYCQNQDGTNTCQYQRGSSCYCYPYQYRGSTSGEAVSPLFPSVRFSLAVSKTANGQTVSQIFQTSQTSRIFTTLDRLNSYAP